MPAFIAIRRRMAFALTASVVLLSVLESASFAETQQFYTQTNLVSGGAVSAPVTDPNLINPWGLAFDPTGGPFWAANNGTGTATVYNGFGERLPASKPLVVTIPTPTGTGTAAPTGIVFNNTGDFPITSGGKSASSSFIIASEDGTLSGWSPSVNATKAVLAVDNSATAIYKGLALASTSNGNLLFGTNFSAGKVNVFNQTFGPMVMPGAFSDPNLPAGFAPFNIKPVNDKLFVTFAKQNATKTDDVPGVGNGVVDVFNTDGSLNRRFATGGVLNSPWGIAQAPSDFGKFSNALLVGNFGDGKIHAFDPNTGSFLGTLDTASGQPLAISGLWSLAFGDGALNAQKNALYFTAGINGETNGLFGTITANPIAIPLPSAAMLAPAGAVVAAWARRRMGRRG